MTQNKTFIIAAALAVAAMSPQVRAADVIAEGDVTTNGQRLSGSQGPTFAGGGIGVGIEQPGRFSVLDGGRADLNGGIGISPFADSSGVVRVDGFGSALRASGGSVAGRGSGLLQITNGGAVNLNGRIDVGYEYGSLGTIDVAGFGSSLRAQEGRFGVLPGSTGRLNVTAGGRATFGSQVSFGGYANGSADATVGGAGSLFSAELIAVNSDATLRVRDGGTVTTEQGISVGGFGGFGGTLVLDGGVLNAFGGLSLNDFGRVEGGGEISGGLEMKPGATLAVAADQTILFTGNLRHDVDGLVQVGAGGTLSFANGIAQVRPMAQIVTRGGEFRAARWEHAGSLVVLDGGTTTVVGDFDNLGGRVSVSGNSAVEFLTAVTNNGTFDVRPGSTATFLGRTNGAGNFAGGGDYVFLGTFAPGNSPAVVNVDGNLTLGVNSTLEVQLYGTALGEFDQTNVSGDVTLGGGDLLVTLGDGFLPQNGDVFEFLTYSSITGSFVYDGFTAANGVTLELRSTPNALQLVAVPEPATLAAAGVGGLLLLRRRRGA